MGKNMWKFRFADGHGLSAAALFADEARRIVSLHCGCGCGVCECPCCSVHRVGFVRACVRACELECCVRACVVCVYALAKIGHAAFTFTPPSSPPQG